MLVRWVGRVGHGLYPEPGLGVVLEPGGCHKPNHRLHFSALPLRYDDRFDACKQDQNVSTFSAEKAGLIDPKGGLEKPTDHPAFQQDNLSVDVPTRFHVPYSDDEMNEQERSDQFVNEHNGDDGTYSAESSSLNQVDEKNNVPETEGAPDAPMIQEVFLTS